MWFKRKPQMVPSVRRLKLERGDSLLVTVPANISAAQVEQIRECVADNLDGTNVLVVTEGIDFTVLSAPDRERLRAEWVKKHGTFDKFTPGDGALSRL